MINLTDKGSFQAGDDLENKIVKVLQTKLNKSNRKFACCDIYKKGTGACLWSIRTHQYLMILMEEIVFVDVRTVDVKGQKRKLLMLDGGEISRMKKCKLEAFIKLGYY